MTCLIVEDEPMAAALLAEYVGQVPFLALAHHSPHALDALHFLGQNRVDLVFLDINLPKLTGLELTPFLRPDQLVVFTTAYSEFALESYERNAVDYLLKPIPFGRFLKAVTRAHDRLRPAEPPVVAPETSEADVFVKTGKALVRVDWQAVRYVEALKDYALFHTETGEKPIVYRRMKELETALPPHFQRIHLSYIVSLPHVRRVEDNHVFVGEARLEVRLPIGPAYREAFLRRIERRVF